MTKCDFCFKSTPDGKCYWSLQVLRERDCEDAIKRMMEFLRSCNKSIPIQKERV